MATSELPENPLNNFKNYKTDPQIGKPGLHQALHLLLLYAQ